MKILIVSRRSTHPVDAGNSKFILNQVELFREMGHEVGFLYIDERPFHDNKSMSNVLVELRNYWDKNLHIFKVSAFNHLLNQIGKKFRIQFCNGYVKADDCSYWGLHNYIKKIILENGYKYCIFNYYYLSKYSIGLSPCLTALTTHDYFAYKDLLTGSRNADFNTTADQEAKALQRFKHIFALNNEEAVYFSKLSPLSKIYNVYSSYEYHDTTLVGNKNILFFSGGNTFNLNGLKWFIKEIFPAITNAFPDTKLIIGGSICRSLDIPSSSNNIELYGYVDNVDDFFKLGDVTINPTYQGTGLKIKTFESLSYGKVVLTHPHSRIGIYKENEAPIFSSENADEWVSYLKQVWNKKEYIFIIKEEDKKYILNMNTFVREEYQKFFNSL